MTIDDQIKAIRSVMIRCGVDASIVRSMIRTMRKDGQSDEAVFRTLVDALYDGIAYGNWPKADG